MEFSLDSFQYLVIAANFIITAFLIGYSIYLYRIERDLRHKFRNVNAKAAKIVEEANNKAIHIINHSKYVSDEMRNNADQSFQKVLEDLESENKGFYKSLEQAYFDKSEVFVKGIQAETEKGINDFSQKIAQTTTETQVAIEKKLEADYEEAKKDINKFKEIKKKEFEEKLKEKIASISASVMPDYLKIDDQEKFAKEVIEKAASEGFFN